jgi:hypothetical protein
LLDKFAPGYQYFAFTLQTDKADVCPQADDLPIGAATGMGLSHTHNVIQPDVGWVDAHLLAFSIIVDY